MPFSLDASSFISLVGVKMPKRPGGTALPFVADELERGDLQELKTTMKTMVPQAVVVKLRHRNLAPAARELIELLVRE